MSHVVSTNGKIGWLGGNGRPDLAAGISIISGVYTTRSITRISDCNQCVNQAVSHKISMKVWPIPYWLLRLVGFCDSSFDFKGERHQQGWLAAFTNNCFNLNQRAPISVCLWRSRKLSRKAGSPQLVETYAASGCVADLHWVKCMLYSSL